MPKLLVLVVLLLASTYPTLAQTPGASTRKPDQYCMLESYPRIKGRYSLTLVVGTEAVPGVDVRQQAAEAEHIKNLTNETDALNYMSSQGWEVVSMVALTTSTGWYGERFCLRRRSS